MREQVLELMPVRLPVLVPVQALVPQVREQEPLLPVPPPSCQRPSRGSRS
jgi:hypothetical protein